MWCTGRTLITRVWNFYHSLSNYACFGDLWHEIYPKNSVGAKKDDYFENCIIFFWAKRQKDRLGISQKVRKTYHYVYVFPREETCRQWYVFPGRKTHITTNMCWWNRETYITRDICFPGRGTQISTHMYFPGTGTFVTTNMYSRLQEHISREAHIPSGMCFPGRRTYITRGMC